MNAVTATSLAPPPPWAFMQRRLIETMEQATEAMLAKYTEPGGALYFADDVDDLYERFANWSLFYAVGAHERVAQMALQQWNATTRWCDDGVVNRRHHNEFHMNLGERGRLRRTFNPQIHNEYYNLAEPAGAEWHHKGEGNMAFYHFGLAHPHSSENVRRARRFAAMYMGEDPEAPNYDPRHRVFRSPFQSSVGPWLHTGDVEAVKSILHGPYPGKNLPWEPKPMGQHASLYPVIAQLEPDWYETPERVPEIIATFNRVVLNSDSANNLAATALVTNAYLYTGEEQYRRWVLDYVEAWLDRIRANGGIIPDNVGPTGKPGEQRDGVWWGGMYGWNSKFGCRMILHAITIAAECALLLSGDFGYLELLRSQLHLLLDNAIHDAGGGLLVPWRHGPGGWARYRPMRVREPVHLWHASMSAADHDLIATLRAGDTGTTGTRWRWRARRTRVPPNAPASNTTPDRTRAGPRRCCRPSIAASWRCARRSASTGAASRNASSRTSCRPIPWPPRRSPTSPWGVRRASTTAGCYALRCATSTRSGSAPVSLPTSPRWSPD